MITIDKCRVLVELYNILQSDPEQYFNLEQEVNEKFISPSAAGIFRSLPCEIDEIECVDWESTLSQSYLSIENYRIINVVEEYRRNTDKEKQRRWTWQDTVSFGHVSFWKKM